MSIFAAFSEFTLVSASFDGVDCAISILTIYGLRSTSMGDGTPLNNPAFPDRAGISKIQNQLDILFGEYRVETL